MVLRLKITKMFDFINRNIPILLVPAKDVVVKTVAGIPGWFGVAMAFVSFRLGMLWESAQDRLDQTGGYKGLFIDLSDLDDSIEKLEYDVRGDKEEEEGDDDDVSSIGSRDLKSDHGGDDLVCVSEDLILTDDDDVSIGSRDLKSDHGGDDLVCVSEDLILADDDDVSIGSRELKNPPPPPSSPLVVDYSKNLVSNIVNPPPPPPKFDFSKIASALSGGK